MGKRPFPLERKFPREADVWKHIGTTSPSTVCYGECMLLCVRAEKAVARCLSTSVQLEVIPLAVGSTGVRTSTEVMGWAWTISFLKSKTK